MDTINNAMLNNRSINKESIDSNIWLYLSYLETPYWALVPQYIDVHA
jgi:hypothetical protein